MTTIYLARHAQSYANVGEYEAHKHERLEPRLTSDGKIQALTLANKLKGIKFDAILSSDLNRARETAEIVALERNLIVKTTEVIRERNFWHYLRSMPAKTEQELMDEMKIDLAKLDERAKYDYKHTKEMESVNEAATRLTNYIREVAIAYKDGKVLIVTHGNVMRCFLNIVGYATFNELPDQAIDNTGYIIVESDGADISVKSVSGVNISNNGERVF